MKSNLGFHGVLILLLIFPLTMSGCLDSEKEGDSDPKYVEKVFYMEGEEYVEENQIKEIISLFLDDSTILLEFTVRATWKDEDDISNTRSYTNQPDMVQIYMDDKMGYLMSGHGENPQGEEGVVIVYYPMDDFENNRLEGARSFEISGEVMHAGDQRPNIGTSFGSIEDNGNLIHCNCTWKILTTEP